MLLSLAWLTAVVSILFLISAVADRWVRGLLFAAAIVTFLQGMVLGILIGQTPVVGGVSAAYVIAIQVLAAGILGRCAMSGLSPSLNRLLLGLSGALNLVASASTLLSSA